MFCSVLLPSVFLAVLINRIYTKEDKQINGTGRQIQNISCPVSSREKAPDILGDVVVIKMEGVKQTSEREAGSSRKTMQNDKAEAALREGSLVTLGSS